MSRWKGEEPMKRLRSTWWIALVLVIAGCGGGDGSSDSTEPAPAATADAPPPSAAVERTQAPPAESAPPAEPASTTSAPAPGPSETLLAIVERGTVRVAYGGFLPPFRDLSGGSEEGFEFALAAEVAAKLAPGATVEFSEVPGSTRYEALAMGDVDLAMTTAVHTLSREDSAAWSQPYLLSGVVALVRADAGISSLADLAGGAVAIPDGNVRGNVMIEALATAGVDYTKVDIFDDTQGIVGVKAGDMVAVPLPWPTAVKEVAEAPEGELTYVPVNLLADPIAIATSRADATFAQEVSAALQEVIDDGTWLTLFENWIGEPPPWTLAEMAGVPPS